MLSCQVLKQAFVLELNYDAKSNVGVTILKQSGSIWSRKAIRAFNYYFFLICCPSFTCRCRKYLGLADKDGAVGCKGIRISSEIFFYIIKLPIIIFFFPVLELLQYK